MLTAAGTAQVASLVKRLDLLNKIGNYEIRGEVLSNVEIDANGKHFIAGTKPPIVFVGRQNLQTTYISDERTIPPSSPVKFDIVGFDATEYIVDANTKALIAPVKANELVKLEGISNQSLYAYNVRGPLGRTQVNKDIVGSINETSLHKVFPLFHNGMTIICRTLNMNQSQITIADYHVVNGCQSLTALFENRRQLTDELRVLTKFVQMEPGSKLAEKVTRFSNNQNGVKPRDFMANNAIQIRLQNEFRRLYKGKYEFEIKRGDKAEPGVIISNEIAGLYLMAFDVKEPWGTHRKYQVFEEKHADLFGRPEVTADRIVLCQVMVEAIDTASSKIENSLFARYVLTRYFLLYCLRRILEKDALASQLLTHPETFVRSDASRGNFRSCIQTLLIDVVVDLNAEIGELGDDFDYRDKLRDADWVKELSTRIVSNHQKLVQRNRTHSFEQEWNAAMQAQTPKPTGKPVKHAKASKHK